MLLDELGIAREEVVVFGDADNDLAILLGVENSVAVDNATSAVKEAAKWHIGPCDDDAVAQALEDIARAVRTGTTPDFMR
jgi:hydroxymethylpyrimidine pyrophosphatase-like HAD family hydrolase